MQRYNWYCRIIVGKQYKEIKKTSGNQMFTNKIVGLNSSMSNCLLIFSSHYCYVFVEKDHL